MGTTLKLVLLELCEISSCGELVLIPKNLQEVHPGGVGHRSPFLTIGFDAKCRGIGLESAWDEIKSAGCPLTITSSYDLYKVLPWEDENCTSERFL